MDLIVELPLSDGFDSILVCVDRFMKMAHFIPTNSNVMAEQAAQLYLRTVFRLHGLPSDIDLTEGNNSPPDSHGASRQNVIWNCHGIL